MTWYHTLGLLVRHAICVYAHTLLQCVATHRLTLWLTAGPLNQGWRFEYYGASWFVGNIQAVMLMTHDSTAHLHSRIPWESSGTQVES